MLTEDGRCTCEIKSRIAMAKAAFNKKKNLYQQIGLKFKEQSSEVLRLRHGSVWCWNLDAAGNRSETRGKYWNVVLEKDGEDQSERSCEKWRSVTWSQWAEEYRTWNKKRKANWIGHILPRNCLLKQVIEGMIKVR